MSDSVVVLLREALETFERGWDEQALQWVLAAWRKSRDERLALLAERLTAVSGRVPVPLDLPRILQGLEEDVGGKNLAALGNVLGELRGPAGDPRLTHALLELAVLPELQRVEVFAPLCDVLLQVSDPRALAPLRALLASLPQQSGNARRLELTLERIAGLRTSPLSAKALARCRALEAAFDRREKRTRHEQLHEPLLARIGAHPEDDEARLVLADLLLEQEDPLGEFIMLQCGPRPDEARAARLLELHREEWEGRLGPGVAPGEVRFERGLPVAVKLQVPDRQVLPPPGPLWYTVREIDWVLSAGAVRVDWLAHPRLRNVTVLKYVQVSLAARLGTHPLPVRKLVMAGASKWNEPGVFRALASLPHLTWLELPTNAEPEDVSLCLDSPLARRLEHFEASKPDAWSLVVTPSAEVPVKATFLSRLGCEEFARVLSLAAGFSTRAVAIHSTRWLNEASRRLLEKAASAYARVEWHVPPE